LLAPRIALGGAWRHRCQHPFAAARQPEPADTGWLQPLRVIGQLWLFHHRNFGFIARVDTALLLTLFAGVCAVAP
jgi:hypothetical protein